DTGDDESQRGGDHTGPHLSRALLNFLASQVNLVTDQRRGTGGELAEQIGHLFRLVRAVFMLVCLACGSHQDSLLRTRIPRNKPAAAAIRRLRPGFFFTWFSISSLT